MIDEEIEAQAHHCNKKKKSAKTVEVCIYMLPFKFSSCV